MRIMLLFAFTIISFFTNGFVAGQQFMVEPFLQQATAKSIWVVWETNSGNESRVEFGLSPFTLTETAAGSAIPNVGGSIIHQTRLTGLQPQTRYYYRVKTGPAVSEVFDFKTPAPSDSGYPVRFAVYSDSQIDGANPGKHGEIVNQGIIDYVSNNYGPILSEELDFVLMPGDLVSNGNTHSHWTDHFFAQAKNLYRHVPLYPVPGNHEVDSPIYFRYFNLPQNGTAGFLEHWYYHDQGNVRIIGLDTNTNYRTASQLNWLENVLDDAAANAQIDFVFAQFHHPHKSELWTPGNTDYSGSIVERLEAFTSASGKPSVHFFGHTHGYSRGQSRDHQHLWVNVATGGGNVDYWGEFPNADYPEYEYTSADYGFLLVESQSGPDPQFSMQRISRGNEVVFKDNELTDSITIRLNNNAPEKPVTRGCATNGLSVDPNHALLQASPFSDPNDDSILESQFQVSIDEHGFQNPVRDVWLRTRNFYSPPNASGATNGYFSVNTVIDPDISKALVTGLDSNTQYFWRVRYRDTGLAWSPWSDNATFTTGNFALGPNLIVNAGAENEISGWTPVEGPLESLTADQCNSGTLPFSGERFFAVGGVCSDEGPYGEAFQRVDVSNQSDSINDGEVVAKFGGRLKNFNGTDRPEIWLVFRSPNQLKISETARLTGVLNQWTQLSQTVEVPSGTHFVDFHISGSRFGGVDNDSYLDDLELQVGSPTADEFIRGDINQDGVVNLLDVLPFVELLTAGQYQPEADVNCDASVDLLDVAIFVELLSN